MSIHNNKLFLFLAIVGIVLTTISFLVFKPKANTYKNETLGLEFAYPNNVKVKEQNGTISIGDYVTLTKLDKPEYRDYLSANSFNNYVYDPVGNIWKTYPMIIDCSNLDLSCKDISQGPARVTCESKTYISSMPFYHYSGGDEGNSYDEYYILSTKGNSWVITAFLSKFATPSDEEHYQQSKLLISSILPTLRLLDGGKLIDTKCENAEVSI